MLSLALGCGYVAINGQQKDAINTVRNRVFHSDKLLIESVTDLGTLKAARDACKMIVNHLHTRNALSRGRSVEVAPCPEATSSGKHKE